LTVRILSALENPACNDYPVSEDVCARHVCLPVFASMRDEQAHQVLDALKRTLG